MKLSNIQSVYTMVNSIYGLTPNETDFEDIVMDGWQAINCKHTRWYRYIADTDEYGVLDLPCNVDVLEDPYWSRGKLVKYDEGDGKLYFSRPYKNVMVVYHGIFVDDETGLPLITDKELRALTTYVAYVTLYKEGLKKRDSGALQIAQDLYQKWLRQCNAARIPEHFSQNDMDKILDVKTCWNRKAYGKSFKPIQ